MAPGKAAGLPVCIYPWTAALKSAGPFSLLLLSFSFFPSLKKPLLPGGPEAEEALCANGCRSSHLPSFRLLDLAQFSHGVCCRGFTGPIPSASLDKSIPISFVGIKYTLLVFDCQDVLLLFPVQLHIKVI
jgi:hypothetical protein